MWLPAADTATIEYGWRHQDLTLLKKPIQIRMEEAWRNSPSNVFVWHISRQVGKSYLALLIAVEECMKNPGYRVVFISHVEKRLEQYLTNIIEKVLGSCPPDIAPTFVNNSLQFKNGSVILMGSDANKAFYGQRGQAYNLVILDEFAFYHSPKELIWGAMYPTIKTTRGRILICTTSPETPAHYFAASILPFVKLKDAYFMATIYDDETSTEEEIEELRKGCLDESYWEREFLCKIVVDLSKAVIPEFNKDRHVKEIIPDEYFQFYLKFVGMDP